MKFLSYIFAMAMIAILPFSSAQASSSGRTGASQGAACNGCHNGGVAPTIVLSGSSTVTLGSINTYTLTMSGGQQSSGGLNVSATAGTLMAIDGTTAVTNGELHQIFPSYADTGGQIAWTFDWTAPLTDATVVLYVGALSSNGNYSTLGDAGATTSLTITVGGGGGGQPVETGESLYIGNCQGCHDPFPGQKANKTAAQIQGAIDNNTGNMGGLSVLTATQVQLIADFLGSGSNLPQAPVAVAGGPYTSALGNQILFDGTASSDADGTVVSYAWDFGDGTTATGATPGHTYATEGTFTVSLTVTDNSGMTGLATTTANVAAGTPPPPVYDGAALYGTNCAGCHDPLASSQKTGRTAIQIQNAINANTGGMGTPSLVNLIPAEIQAIADALVGTPTPQAPVANPGSAYSGVTGTAVQFNGNGSTDVDGTIVAYAWDFGDNTPTGTGATPSHTYATTGLFTVSLTVTDNTGLTGSASTTANIGSGTPPPPVVDGLALYATHCSSCHNAAPGTKAGRTATQIQDAINTVSQMGSASLASLTSTEVQAIADALGNGTPTPQAPVANPGSAYSGVVGTAVQFNGGASTDVDGAIVAYAWDFGDGVTGNGVTSSHTYAATGLFTVSLTVTDDTGLTGTASTTANIGSGTPPPPVVDGLALYGSYCSGCHSAAPGTKAGRTATQIQTAINVVQSMAGLSSLTSAEVQAIADAIATGGGTPASDGEGLYNQYCSSCHGAEGRGGEEEDVRGESARSISSAIDEESDMRYLSSLVSSEEIALISDYLNGRDSGGDTGGGTITVTKQSQYDTYCGACHGAEGRGGAEEDVRGESASGISDAISAEQDMNYLSGLSDTIIRAISDYLNGDNGSIEIPAPSGGGGSGDGLALYGAYCAGCHSTAPGTKAGRTAAQIQSAINGVSSMSGLTSLTAVEVQAIADAIGGGGTGGGGTGGGDTGDGIITVTKQSQYDTYCGACHGAEGRGGAEEDVRGESASGISDAISAEQDMNYLSGLSDTIIRAISDYLNGDNGTIDLPAPSTGGGSGDGLALYAANCAGCHSNAPGTKAGRTAAQIQAAINNVSTMNGLTSLSAAEVQAIADAIGGGGGGTPAPTTPEGLYTTYCAACHGAGGNGGTAEAISGASAGEISDAIAAEVDMNYLSALLASSSIDAIAQYLGGATGGGGDTGGGTITVTKQSQYDTYCGACHGVEGRGGAEGGVRGESASGISDAISAEQDMNYLSGLSDTIIRAISDYLNGDNGTIDLPAPSTGGGSGDGLALYSAYCAGCHNAAPGTKAGRSAAQIQSAINGVSSMSGLSSLTAAQVQAIADAIGSGGGTGGGGTGGGTGTPDGLALYAANCAGCHSNAPGTKAGRTAAQIQSAINGVSSMNGLTSLSAAEVQAIADAIGGGGGGGTPAPTTPEGLYTTYCAACHGAGGYGGVEEGVRGISAGDISDAIAAESDMNYLSGLDSSTISAIAQYLDGGSSSGGTGGGGTGTGGTGTPDGLALYAANCAGCHNNAPGTMAGRSAAQIQTAINNVGSMSGLTGLSAAEVQAIADAIATGGGSTGGGGTGTGTPDGLALYAANCAGCHSNAPGTKAGRTAAQIQAAINGVASMNGLTSLSAAEVQAIADAIGGSNAPPASTTPEGLYTSYCAACHGAGGDGGIEEAVRGASSDEIVDAIQNEADMTYLSGLDSGTISAIAQYLSENNGESSSSSTSSSGGSRDWWRFIFGGDMNGASDGGGGALGGIELFMLMMLFVGQFGFRNKD